MKLRGRKKYYRNLINHEIPEWIDFDKTDIWFDFFHQHIDNKDIGNERWKSREQHLNALFTLAEKYEIELSKMNCDYQFWININERDSDDDAIYIHTKNPNKSEFPVKVKNYHNLKSKNENLEKYIESKAYKIIRFPVYDENKSEMINYYLYKDGLGISMDKNPA